MVFGLRATTLLSSVVASSTTRRFGLFFFSIIAVLKSFLTSTFFLRDGERRGQAGGRDREVRRGGGEMVHASGSIGWAHRGEPDTTACAHALCRRSRGGGWVGHGEGGGGEGVFSSGNLPGSFTFMKIDAELKVETKSTN